MSLRKALLGFSLTFLFMTAPSLADQLYGNESGHGGDPILNRILLARAFALQIVAHVDEKVVTAEQKAKMVTALGPAPKFTAPGQKLMIKDQDGRDVQVAAEYFPKTGETVFDVAYCRELGLGMIDAVALYLHEAGHAAGLSHCMVRNRQDLLSDIGYRLVLLEKDRPDSVFSDAGYFGLYLANESSGQLTSPAPAPAPPPTRRKAGTWYTLVIKSVGNPKWDASNAAIGAKLYLVGAPVGDLEIYLDSRYVNVIHVHDLLERDPAEFEPALKSGIHGVETSTFLNTMAPATAVPLLTNVDTLPGRRIYSATPVMDCLYEIQVRPQQTALLEELAVSSLQVKLLNVLPGFHCRAQGRALHCQDTQQREPELVKRTIAGFPEVLSSRFSVYTHGR